MKNRVLTLCLILCLLLSGCGNWMDGSYSSSRLHHSSSNQSGEAVIAVSNYSQLRQTLADLVESGAESVLINVAEMDMTSIDQTMDQAIWYILAMNPIGAYAVESIEYEQGTSGGRPALSVTVHYNQNRAALRSLKEANNMSEATEIVSNALDQCETKVVMHVHNYRTTDFEEYVRIYMEENPQTVMELPNLTISTFPESGTQRLVEIVFTYQTGREDLRMMQNRVRPLFTSAELYVAGNNTDYEQYELLYAFLMERHDYQFETSITPAYSLLVHGVGNSKAFAVVFAAMCRRADLECYVVSGTCNGEPQFWNIVYVDGTYHHLDLLSSSRNGVFSLWGDEEMGGYVWDYSSYPKCDVYVDPAELTEPTQTTDPEETGEPTTEPEEMPTEPDIEESDQTETPTGEVTSPGEE